MSPYQVTYAIHFTPKFINPKEVKNDDPRIFSLLYDDAI